MTAPIFYNLTNGIEDAAKILEEGNGSPVNFVRIQSTWCEQHRWGDILEDLDYKFVVCCRVCGIAWVVDRSSKKAFSRALYQGLSWIYYAMNRYWYGKETKVYVKGNDVTGYFQEQYERLPRDAFKKLRYAKRFRGAGNVVLIGESKGCTNRDGDYGTYGKMLRSVLNFERNRGER